MEFKDKQEILEFMTDAMVEKGYINQEIKQSIFKREEMSTTELGSLVAIPHALFNDMQRFPSYIHCSGCRSVNGHKRPHLIYGSSVKADLPVSDLSRRSAPVCPDPLIDYSYGNSIKF